MNYISDDSNIEDPEDQKVLNLAEQFIAAMPERIKVFQINKLLIRNRLLM